MHSFSSLFLGLCLLTQSISTSRVRLGKDVADLCTHDTALGVPNLNAIDDSAPVLINRVQNGSLYTIGAGDDRMWLVHVWGTKGYDYGFAYGTLLKEQISQFVPRAWTYFQAEVTSQLKSLKLPKWYERLIQDKGLGYALDSQNNFAQVYVDNEIYQELRGIADAAKVDYTTLRRLHMLGEVTRGRCSLYGLWGNATRGGKTLQLRALDWDLNAGLQDFPVVTVYHPLSTKLGNTFVNVAWAGFIGTLTGMSSQRLGVSEIGVSLPDKTFGDEDFAGLPFIFVQRNILQYSQTLDDALAYINKVRKTCRLIVGIADGKIGTARMIQYSSNRVSVYDDETLQPLTEWHPRLPNAVYAGMDWQCPAYQYKLYKQIQQNHGEITPELSIEKITSVAQTGDLHVAVYDLTDNQLYVANARGSNEQGPMEAYQRQFVKVDLNVEFAREQ